MDMGKIRNVIKIINRMASDRVIQKYAIGGAVGATFYIEPVSTMDIDIFIPFEPTASGIVLLTPIYEYLSKLGYSPVGQHISIEGQNVEFLPADKPLPREAIDRSVQRDIAGVSASVMTAEHLMAIALDAGRHKDLARLEAFTELNAAATSNVATYSVSNVTSTTSKTVLLSDNTIYDPAKLRDILSRHGLLEKWEKFEQSRNRNTT